CSCIEDFDFIKKMTNLKVLYIEGNSIKVNDFDFVNNNKLEFIALNNITKVDENCIGIDTLFDLNIKNIPTNLKYLDLSLNGYLKFDNIFLKKIETIPNIFLDSMEYEKNKDYFDKHKNFKFEFPEEILPQEYHFEELRKKPEYFFYKLEDLDDKK
ncbi:MAG: hypothetical protein JXJ04_20135, partial [Spirochaetales bacterium]|nr:hypothetical protein [Spirochaetales bacterium]